MSTTATEILIEDLPALIGIDGQGNEKSYKLSDFAGKRVVLYFYPKDNTSGCTREACDFRDSYDDFPDDTQIIGVSPDSLKSHNSFRQKHGLNFILLSDSEHLWSNHFGVWKSKSMYGRQYMGIERSTFVLDSKGQLIKEWRKVKVAGHSQAVLEFLQNN